MDKDFGNDALYKEDLLKANQKKELDAEDNSSELVFNGESDINVVRGKSRKKKVTPKKPVNKTSTKTVKSKRTKTVVNDDKKVAKKVSSKSKVNKTNDIIRVDNEDEKIIVTEPFVEDENHISGELLKVSNIKSREQVKKPKRIIFLASVYSILMLSLVVALFIKLSKPKKTLLKDPDETFADVGETRLLLEREETEENNEVIEETLLEDEDFENSSKLIFERLKEASIEKEKKKIENKKKETEETTEEIIEETTEEEIEETTEEIVEETTEETTKKIVKKETIKKVSDKEETTKKVVAKEETTEKETKKKNETEKEETTIKKTTTDRKSMSALLPNYKNVIYSIPFFNQFSINEIGILSKGIETGYKAIEDNLFGNDVPVETKGKNGVVYLNNLYISEFTKNYTSDTRQRYDRLPETSYAEYVLSSDVGYSNTTYTNNLSVKFDFKNAKNETDYYEIPAIFYEKDGNTKKYKVRVLKKAKVGFANDFNLSAMLEVLDIEWNTKNNPLFDIEECVGAIPKVKTTFKNPAFNIPEMLECDKFNKVFYDRKGYITAIFRIS